MPEFAWTPPDRLRRRTSMKWRAYPPDVLPLWVAEMDVDLAEPVVRAVCDAMRTGDTGYPAGYMYAEALDRFARTRWGWDGVVAERTAIVADVMIGISETLQLLTGPGDAVIVNCPVYPPFYAFVAHIGRRVVEAPLDAAHRIDLAALEQAFAAATTRGRPAAYVLCNPHNPTGTAHAAAELTAIAELAARYGVRVVADEVHAPLVLQGSTFTPYLTVPGAASGFAVHSASKGWNLGGLKAALVVAGPDASADLARLPEIVSHGPSHVAIIGHAAAFGESVQWLDELVAALGTNRELLVRLVSDRLPDVRMPVPQATFLSWLDFRGIPGMPGDDGAVLGDVRTLGGPAAYLLEHARVALNAGATFGTGGAGHVRLNFATSPQLLTEAIERIARAVRPFENS